LQLLAGRCVRHPPHSTPLLLPGGKPEVIQIGVCGSPDEICELASADLTGGDVLVFYADGVTETENRLGEEFGMERLSALVRDASSPSAEHLTSNILN